MTAPLVSLVVPAFNEAESAAPLVGLFREIEAAHPQYRFELVLVDDGSTDGTATAVLAALEETDQARIASFSRNFGSHAAISAGFALCRGACALTLSADLQEPIEVVGRFLRLWEEGNDVVWGVRSTRAMRRGPSYGFALLFSRALNRHSDIPGYPSEGPSQILVTRTVIDAVNAMPERNRNVLGIVAWVGFNQATLSFEQLPRHASTSKWTLTKKVKLVIDSFTEFSSAPIKLVSALGIALLGLAVVGALALLGTGLVSGSWPSGLLWLGCGVVLLTGLQLVALGTLGEYLWRTADDARQRPLYVLRSVTDVGQAEHISRTSRTPATRIR